MMSPSGGGQRPRVVRPAPDEHVAGERRRRRAAHVDVGPVEVHLQRQAGVVEPDLRAADEERRAGLRRLSAGDEDVARHLRRAVGMVDRGGARGRRARGAREPGRRRAEAAVDDAHHAARVGHAGLRLVGEALRRRGSRLGVGAPAQVLVGLVAAGGAELGARGVEERGVGDLLAAALAQELRLDRVERVDVGARERRRRRLVLRVPEVDAREVDVDVAQQPAPGRALRLDRLGLLRRRLVEDLLGRLVAVEAEQELDGGHARDVDEPRDAVGARQVEQQRAVGRLDVAGGEEDARVGVAVDVRDAVGVALDARADGADAGRRARDGVAGDERRVVLVDQRRRLVVAACRRGWARAGRR